MNIQNLEDYFLNNDATIVIQSYYDNDTVEYEAFLELNHGVGESVEEICRTYGYLSIEDTLEKLSEKLGETIK